MSNNNIDLDINSYDFFELLNIYHLSNDNNYENLNKIEDKLKLIKIKFSTLAMSPDFSNNFCGMKSSDICSFARFWKDITVSLLRSFF